MTIALNPKLADILLAEDSLADIDLVQARMDAAQVNFNLHPVRDGEKALDFLHRRNNYLDVPEPDIIFLDLNLPKIDGVEVLTYIKEHKDLRHIPVVIVSGSDLKCDVERTRALGACDYVTKPLNYEKLQHIIAKQEHFYFEPRGEKTALYVNVA